MLTSSLVLGFIALASATTQQDSLFAALLKRQEPGTPAYACHEACGTFIRFLAGSRITNTHTGTAITLSKGADPCTNAGFTTQYDACLQCAGPDDVNIWRYYGGTLGKAGAACGLDTQPRAGPQSDGQSVTQGEIQGASSTVVGGSSGAASASTTLSLSSGQALDTSTSAPSASGIVLPSTSVSTVVSLPCFWTDCNNDVGLDSASRGINKCCGCATWWGGLWIRRIRGYLCCCTVWYVSGL
jgi:hypothetical protein